jgi:hypothetical protein
VNESHNTCKDEDDAGIGTIIRRFRRPYTIRVRNSSGITRRVLIISKDNAWEWTLPLKRYETFKFYSHTNTMFNMSDYTSGTRFDIYGRRAPMWKDVTIELYDTHIQLNEKSIAYDELRQKYGL